MHISPAINENDEMCLSSELLPSEIPRAHTNHNPQAAVLTNRSQMSFPRGWCPQVPWNKTIIGSSILCTAHFFMACIGRVIASSYYSAL